MTTFWCEHAVLPGGVRRSVRVVTDRGRILDVRPDVPAEAGDTRLGGVVLPGLANGHSHAFHRALRGRTHDDGGNFWTWRDAMYAVTHRLDPETYHALAKAVFAEMLLAGYTAVGEFHYVHHAAGGRRYDDPNIMGKALISAAREVGIRITLLDTCYLAGGLTAGGHVPLESGMVNRYLRETTGEDITAKDFRTWHGTVQAAQELGACGTASTETEARRNVVAATKAVAGKLGNRPATCRKHYIHTAVQ